MNLNNLSKLEARISICEFLERNKNINMPQAIKCLKILGFKETTIRRIYKRYINNKDQNMSRKMSKKQILRKKKICSLLLKEIQNRPFKSFRKLAKRVGCAQKTVQKYLLEMDIKCKTKKIVPKVSDKQYLVQNSRLKKFVTEFLRKKKESTLIIDDDSYFTLNSSKWEEKNYYVRNGLKITNNDEFIEKTKYPQKVMMWIAISDKGISMPHFFKGVSSINSAIYSKDCLSKLSVFIKKYHKNDNFLFWPDLASCHYSSMSRLTMNNLDINFLPKDKNPPNCPQIRPIEKFWSYIKRHVYKGNAKFKNMDELISRIKYLLKTLDLSRFRLSMQNLPKRIRKAQKVGLKNTF